MKIAVRSAFSVALALLVSATIGAASALADDQYGGGGGQSTSSGSSGALPFTGADLVLYAVVGVAVLASGLLLRRLAARRSR